MTTIAILPEWVEGNGTQYRAVGGGIECMGNSAGEALDALTAQLDAPHSGIVVLIQSIVGDAHLTAEQQRRLSELMVLWRRARDTGKTLRPRLQQELESLTQAEQAAALERTKELQRELAP